MSNKLMKREHFEPALTGGYYVLGCCPEQPRMMGVFSRRLCLVCSFGSESLLSTDMGLRRNSAGISLFQE